ncbi:MULTISPECIES: SIR2 family protein [unclassified Mycobacterium]|uniref:SIR2 family NAD-dependent protein deacylase n=1 Tax=unclassified Mycobacterium TaxID=2642494 RepID=UPI0018D1D6FD|nr:MULTISPECIES: SIR2 family protein [unclassified Mycobacterium]
MPQDQAEKLRAVNAPGLNDLRRYLAEGKAVAFLGAGASTPIYPLWGTVIGQLIDAAVERGLPTGAAETCRQLADKQPDAAVEVLRRRLGLAQYRSALSKTFKVRTDPESNRTWTPIQELVCRCAFKAVVTTNYDPGIVDARMRVRTSASATGFTSWNDELPLDDWYTGDVFDKHELPVLFAHGHHNEPDAMVLATTDFRRAYAGSKLADVLQQMMRTGHLVWIGFSFADQRINAVLREVAEHAGTRTEPGAAPRHVAIMSWDPGRGHDPETLRDIAEISYLSELVLYPAPNHDHSALQKLLATVTDNQYRPAEPLAIASTPTPTGKTTTVSKPSTRGPLASPARKMEVRWVHGEERARSFTGRAEELARLDRWAADPSVRLVGVTAWGGAGKTALVTHWLQEAGGATRRSGIWGLFGWSFFADPSADHWARALLKWAPHQDAVEPSENLAAAVVAAASAVPMVLVLDGLEIAQEGPGSDTYGRLLDGTLREVLTTLCRVEHNSLVVLTSRFPFADLQGFDGSSARMLDVPPFTPTEGAALLATTNPDALDDEQRRRLVAEVDGHALALTTIAAMLSERAGAATTANDLFNQLASSRTTESKVAQVLNFYAEQLSEADRYLVAAVSLFVHPVTAEQLLTVTAHETFGELLTDWDKTRVQEAVQGPLAGLLTWHPDATITAHPLVRQTFRPLAIGAARTAVDITLTETYSGPASDRAQAQLLVEAVELLIDADQWGAAHDLYVARTRHHWVWYDLPAVRLGQRATTAFVANPARRDACRAHLGDSLLLEYLGMTGVFAMYAGDVATGVDFLNDTIHFEAEITPTDLSIWLQSLAACLARQGQVKAAERAATDALTHAKTANDAEQISDSHAWLAWVAGMGGNTGKAERHFLDACRTEAANHHSTDQISPVAAIRWGEFLARTRRSGPARRLTGRIRDLSQRLNRGLDVARCSVLMARLDLAEGDLISAADHLSAAVQTFRDGDVMIELADALTAAADHARQTGDLVLANDHVTEALAIAAAGGLIPIQVAAQTMRAHIAVNSFAASPDPKHLHFGRDAADMALHLSTGAHSLPWHELGALRARALLDEAEGVNDGWDTRAEQLENKLIPEGLDPDPIGDQTT